MTMGEASWYTKHISVWESYCKQYVWFVNITYNGIFYLQWTIKYDGAHFKVYMVYVGLLYKLFY